MKYLLSFLLFLIPLSSAQSTESITTLSLIFKQEAQAAGVPEVILASVCWIESHHNIKQLPVMDGKSHSFGICQVKRSTARLVKVNNISSVRGNIRAAAKYLAYQQKRYGHWDKAIVAYNSGSYRRRTSYLIKVKLRVHEYEMGKF